jgi:thiamine phosphate synthase YjbQ (UPF0047 family)
MLTAPLELSLEIKPDSRLDIIDVWQNHPRADVLQDFPHALYCSFHTTAGFLDQGLASRLEHASAGVRPYISAFQALFPEGAGYRHDDLHLREELSDVQRGVEPRNADAHLAFIAAGLRTCVKYANRPGEPVYFVDLDGVNGETSRQRLTRILAFNQEEIVARECVPVSVSSHPLDSVNLKGSGTGLYERLEGLIAKHGVTKGRIRLSLGTREHHAGLTINEYETLLMRHDLIDVIRDPMRFVAEKGRNLLADPWAIPARTIDYAKYDFVRVFNEVCDALHFSESFVETIVARAIGFPVRRFLRMKRAVSLLVTDSDSPGRGAIVEGRYQCPILVQWRKSQTGQRLINVTLTRLT